jgi:putative protein kinase ArgK-like GTPase of G3E family
MFDQDLSAVISDLMEIARKNRTQMGDTTLARVITTISYCANAQRKSNTDVINELVHQAGEPGMVGMAMVLTYFVFKELERESTK